MVCYLPTVWGWNFNSDLLFWYTPPLMLCWFFMLQYPIPCPIPRPLTFPLLSPIGILYLGDFEISIYTLIWCILIHLDIFLDQSYVYQFTWIRLSICLTSRSLAWIISWTLPSIAFSIQIRNVLFTNNFGKAVSFQF